MADTSRSSRRPPSRECQGSKRGGQALTLAGRGEHPGGGASRDSVVPPEQREREELQSLLRELTRYVSVQDAMRSLDTVCQDLKKAIKKLDKLLRTCKVRCHVPCVG